jgi:hypothetical protein
MENVILSDEQLEELSDGMQKIYKEEVSLDYNSIYDGMLMKAEARHLLCILKEPCPRTQHESPIGTLKFNCPECMKQIEKEIG